jgi:hypothetical protein
MEPSATTLMRPRRNRSVLRPRSAAARATGVGRAHADHAQQRHQAHRVAVGGRRRKQQLEFGVAQRRREVGGGGHAGAHAQLAEGADAGGVAADRKAAFEADLRQHRHHRLRALELAGRQPVGAERECRVVDAGRSSPALLQRRAVDVEDVAAGVQHAHRPLRLTRSRSSRVQRRCRSRWGRSPSRRPAARPAFAGGLGQLRDHRVERVGARPDAGRRGRRGRSEPQ